MWTSSEHPCQGLIWGELTQQRKSVRTQGHGLQSGPRGAGPRPGAAPGVVRGTKLALCCLNAVPGSFSVNEVLRAQRSDACRPIQDRLAPPDVGSHRGRPRPVLLLDPPPLPSWKAGGAAAGGAEGGAVAGAHAQGACSGRTALLHSPPPCEKGRWGRLLLSDQRAQGALEFASVGQR